MMGRLEERVLAAQEMRARKLDALADRLIGRKQDNPHDARIDRALADLGTAMCRHAGREIAYALRHPDAYARSNPDTYLNAA